MLLQVGTSLLEKHGVSLMSAFNDSRLVAAALQAAATALAGNEDYETPRGIAELAHEILEEWDKLMKKRR